ncbi:MAG: polymer-forming cytoskeletal protein [Candidatus Aminicenantes bacterium]|nr:polymer-forming cytoskeletal protein [Candidatus Aminicenantes bacterium]
MRNSERENKEDRSLSERPNPDKVTLLGPAISFNGELNGDEDLVIEGKFRGKIKLENSALVVEKDAEVDAEIRAHNITIKGKVKGDIYASGKVYIEKEGRMIGNISAARISIMEGAQFKGSMKMISRIQP